MARSVGDERTIAEPGRKKQLFREGSENPGGVASAMLVKEKMTNGAYVPASLTKGLGTKRGR